MQSLTHRLATAPCLPWPDTAVSIALVITDLDVGGAGAGHGRTWQPAWTAGDGRRWSLPWAAEGRLARGLRRGGSTLRMPGGCIGGGRSQAVMRLARALRSMPTGAGAELSRFMPTWRHGWRLAWAGRPWVVGGLRVAERRNDGTWSSIA